MTLFSLIVVLYALSQFILIGSFTQLEKQDAQQNIERARDTLFDDIDRQESVARDWAAWDDTYNFVQNGNEAYIDSNLDTSTIANLQINFMFFYNISGRLVYGTGVDLRNKKEIALPKFFQHDLSPDDVLLKHNDTNSKISGIIILPEGPMIIASNPITTSERKGPIRGTLITGSYLDSAEIERLSRITHLSLSINRFNDTNISDFSSANQFLSKEKPVFIQPLSNEIIAAYYLIYDIKGNPAVVIRTELPRGIHKQGENTSAYLVLSIIGAGLVFGLLTIFLLEKNVLSRLSYLSSNVNAIGATGNRSMRVTITGNDELSNLAKMINGMLEELEKAEEENKKQLLFKEIYHRVKNNLQIVISLLNLQSRKTTDKNAIEILKDSQNRIKSMALIHERLYKSKDLKGIYLNEYIQDLANNLFSSYGVNSGIVKLKIDVVDITLNLDTAIPCGLIVTELVSNSLKHAFPAGRQGELLIKLHSDKNETFTLKVKDDGIGFPKDIDFRKTNTLGLQLVTGLVDQLKGTIELDRSEGTGFKIIFKEKK